MLLLFIFGYKYPSLLYLELALDFGGGKKHLNFFIVGVIIFKEVMY
jgi:hypothetical protein